MGLSIYLGIAASINFLLLPQFVANIEVGDEYLFACEDTSRSQLPTGKKYSDSIIFIEKLDNGWIYKTFRKYKNGPTSPSDTVYIDTLDYSKSIIDIDSALEISPLWIYSLPLMEYQFMEYFIGSKEHKYNVNEFEFSNKFESTHSIDNNYEIITLIGREITLTPANSVDSLVFENGKGLIYKSSSWSGTGYLGGSSHCRLYDRNIGVNISKNIRTNEKVNKTNLTKYMINGRLRFKEYRKSKFLP